MGEPLVGLLVVGVPRLGGLQHLERLRQTYGGLDGLALLRAVLKDGPLAGRIALVSSFGTESAVLLDMVASIDPATPVIFLDTGKLFAETHGHREALVDLLQLRDVRVVGPEPAALAQRDARGDLWQQDPDACCQLRKTAALQTALAGFGGWITGRKRFQGGVRRQLPTVEPECSSGRIKINPLAPWSAEDVERYRILRNLPKHPLADQGYRSIGCIPCTRPVSAHEPQRAGRWWGLDKSECGIHSTDQAFPSTAATADSAGAPDWHGGADGRTATAGRYCGAIVPSAGGQPALSAAGTTASFAAAPGPQSRRW
jgi:phosphoadenosine phosphosulfate reductase